jgi:uncharacterized protein YjbI with pentapeptide repeats
VALPTRAVVGVVFGANSNVEDAAWMVKAQGGRARPAGQSSSPQFTDFDADILEVGRDYDSILFADRDFSGQDAADARFLECRFERCCVEGLSMRRARLVDCLLADVFGASVDFADSTWRNSRITGGRLGALTLSGAAWTDVRVRGVKLGFVNLAGARLEDVAFEECEIGSLDAGSAQLRSVAFVDCAVAELNVAEATLSKVDLSGARLKTLVGVESLRGAIIGRDQLLDLAPLLAAQLGVEVRED